MEKNPVIKWWREEAASEFRQAVFSELYGLHLFTKEPLGVMREYYRFGRDELGDAVWLLQRDHNRQEYEILRVEEARKLSSSQPVWPNICSFWENVPVDLQWLSTGASINDVRKMVTKGGKDLAQRVNRYFVNILLESAVDSRLSAQNVSLSDLLAEAGDQLSSKGFSADRLLFPTTLQHRLIQQDVLIPDDEIDSNHYVGRTKTGLFAFSSDELPNDVALIFDSTANLVITKDGRFEVHPIDSPFFEGVGGVVYLNPIVKNVESVVALDSISEALNQEGRSGKLKIKQAKDEVMFVDLARIDELREASSSSAFDLVKLIKLCEELNICYANECFLAVPMLTRAILDHVPPIFGFQTFKEVANNYGGKSFKNSMRNLQNSLRHIADSHLHLPIRSKESLPSRVQVNFSNDVDVLLAEAVRRLR